MAEAVIFDKRERDADAMAAAIIESIEALTKRLRVEKGERVEIQKAGRLRDEGKPDSHLMTDVIMATIKDGARKKFPGMSDEKAVALYMGEPEGAELYAMYKSLNPEETVLEYTARLRGEAKKAAVLTKMVGEKVATAEEAVDVLAKRLGGGDYAKGLQLVSKNMPNLIAEYQREARGLA